MRNDLLNGLTEEQIAKVKACKSPDELMTLARNEGVELTDEQLAAISGGSICQNTPSFTCPNCGSSKINSKYCESNMSTWYHNECKECGHHWNVNA